MAFVVKVWFRLASSDLAQALSKQAAERAKEGRNNVCQRLVKGLEAGLRITFDASWVFVFEFKRRCRT